MKGRSACFTMAVLLAASASVLAAPVFSVGPEYDTAHVHVAQFPGGVIVEIHASVS